jgi:hypothetical protein
VPSSFLSSLVNLIYPLFHGVSHYSKLGFYNRAEFVIYCHNYDNTYGYGVEYPCILFYFSFSCFQTLCLLFLFGLWAFRAETLSSLNIFFRTIIPSHLYFSKTFTSYPSRVNSSVTANIDVLRTRMHYGSLNQGTWRRIYILASRSKRFPNTPLTRFTTARFAIASRVSIVALPI